MLKLKYKLLYTFFILIIFLTDVLCTNSLVDEVNFLVVNYSQFHVSLALGLLALTFSFKYSDDYSGDIEKLKKKQSKNLKINFNILFLLLLIQVSGSFQSNYTLFFYSTYILSALYIYYLIQMFAYIYREIHYGTR
jgi:hypothetical protein